MNKQIMQLMGFVQEVALVENGLCPFCGKDVGEFRDALSRKEFEISGLCQRCQDRTFGGNDDAEER